MVKVDAPSSGGMQLDPKLFVDFGSRLRGHQVRLQGGDASSDFYCYP
jgi:methanethiol oxidase